MTAPSQPRRIDAMRRETRIVIFVSSLAALGANLPYVFAPLLAPPGHRFMGHVFNPDEPNVYLAWIRQHAEGSLLAKDPFTTEGPQVGFFNLFLFALGVLSALLRLDPIWLWHASRVVGCFALVASAWALSRRALSHPLAWRLSLWLVSFGSGLGWLQALGVPLDSTDYRPRLLGLITPETVNFLSMLVNPLFSLSISLELLALSFWLDALKSGRPRGALKPGLVLLLLGNIHTYDLAALLPAIALHAMLVSALRRSFRPLLIALVACGLCLPSIGLQFVVFLLDPVFREKALTPTSVPPLGTILNTLGLPLLGAVAGGILGLAKSERREEVLLLVLWPICALLSAHLPVSFQRKALEGVQCALALLSAQGLAVLLASARERGPGPLRVARLAVFMFVALCAPSNALFLADVFRNLSENNALLRPALMPRFYLSRGQVEAAKFIGRIRGEADVALSSPTYANYLPRLSGVTVFAGHWAETLRYPEKVRIIPLLYSKGAPNSWRLAFLKAHRIRFVLYGPEEREYGFDSPSEGGWARLVARFGDTEVYEVER